MMKKNKKKIIIILLLMLLTFSTNYKCVYAEGGGSGGGGGGNDGNWNGSSGSGSEPSCNSVCELYYCSYSWNWNKRTDVEIEMLDLEGNRNQTSLFAHTSTNEFLAGTHVMLKVYQTQEFNYYSSYEVKAMMAKWRCDHYEIEDVKRCPVEIPPGEDECPEEEKKVPTRVYKYSYEALCACDSGDDCRKFVGWVDTTGDHLDECASNIESVDKTLEPMYKAVYKDSNDIENKEETVVEGHECPKSVKVPGKKEGEISDVYTSTINNKCKVSYDREAEVCINVKNGNVRYLDDQTNGQCKEDEMKVTPNSDGYWKYFIPLDANSSDDFSFQLISSGAIEEKAICDDIKSKYTYWDNIIDEVGDGCIFNTEVTIPVIQRFYNELEDGKTFKGFNFYYKPIDINEPFPNGLTDTSIWYEWNKDKNNPNISKSYEKLTYYANTSQNENEIRKYNNQKEYDNGKKDYPYASWEGKNENDTEGGMNKEGTSNFIDNKDIVTRRTEDFYRLGCGPKNTNVNNIFTQTECDR